MVGKQGQLGPDNLSALARLLQLSHTTRCCAALIPSESMPRLFTAIELPRDICVFLADLRMPLPGAKWVEPEDMHLTLRFAGDIDNQVARELRFALEAIDERAFPLRVSGLGAFGGNQPRTLWAGVEACDALDALVRANQRAARNAGIASETKPFKAHITLARLNGTRADEVALWIQAHGSMTCPPFLVDYFVLISSRPKVGGGPYVVEEEYPLQRGF